MPHSWILAEIMYNSIPNADITISSRLGTFSLASKLVTMTVECFRLGGRGRVGSVQYTLVAMTVACCRVPDIGKGQHRSTVTLIGLLYAR